MTDPRAPCIIGVAQRTIRPDEGPAPEPLVLWADAVAGAAADSGGSNIVESVDDLRVIYSLSWRYDDPPARLAERLGLREGTRHLSGLSGTGPQKFVQAAADEIRAGRSDVSVVVGAEALATKKAVKREGRRPDWSFAPTERLPMPFDDPFHPSEIAHQVLQAYLTFAVFDSARRAHLGLGLEAHRRHLGEKLAPLSRVAARNPRAWLPVERTAEELVTVAPGNRMVAFPYTVRTVSVLDVDMAAAVIVASHEKADALGVPADRRVYLRGGCHARDPVYVAEHDALWRSPAMREASAATLAAAGIGIDDVAHLDLYSCFGSSIDFACDALGIADDDARPLTVTGGLPFHGGPGNNYLTHSIATLVEKLREDPDAFGLVSGVGMHMTNHVFGVYSARPAAGPPRRADEVAVQARVDATPKRRIRDEARGAAQIAAYSVVHGREGPTFGLAVCELPGGDRCYANFEEPDALAALEAEECVGQRVDLVDGGRGRNGAVLA